MSNHLELTAIAWKCGQDFIRAKTNDKLAAPALESPRIDFNYWQSLASTSIEGVHILAGRQQHYIPQFLLREFGTKKKGKKTQVWVFDAERGCFPTGTQNIAQQRDFYSTPSEEPKISLDQKITDHEGALSQIHKDMLALADQSIVESETAAEFVAHMIVRSVLFRQTFSVATESIVSGIKQIAKDPVELTHLLGFDRSKPSQLISDEMQKIFNSLPKELKALFGGSFRAFETVMYPAMQDQFSNNHSEQITATNKLLDDLASNKDEILKTAHQKALTTSHTPEAWVSQLKEFDWRVVKDGNATVILPDCLAIGRTEHGDFEPYFLSKKEEAVIICVPIGCDAVLVGSKDNDKEIDVSSLMTSLAKCSWQFFVAKEKSDANVVLHKTIGATARAHVDSMMDDILNEFRTEGL